MMRILIFVVAEPSCHVSYINTIYYSQNTQETGINATHETPRSDMPPLRRPPDPCPVLNSGVSPLQVLQP